MLTALLWLLVLGGVLTVILAFPVIALVRAGQAIASARRLEARLAALEEEFRARTRPEPGARPAATPAPEALTAAPETEAPLPPVPPVPAGPEPEPAAISPAVEPVPAPPAPESVPPPVPSPAPSAEGAPQTIPATPPFVAARARPPGGAESETLESRIGSRWLLYVGVAAIVIGSAYFVKYAFDNDWITERMQVALGMLGGLVMIGAGARLAGRGYALYGQVLAGGGVPVLYIAIYVAHHAYALIGRPLTFALMVAVAGLAAVVARAKSLQPLAFVAVAGGFTTPFLVGGGGSYVTLFGYDLVLAAATLYLAYTANWPLLNVASFALTWLTIVAWSIGPPRTADYLGVQVFVTALAALFALVLRETARKPSDAARVAALILASGPFLFHFWSIDHLRHHPAAFLVYSIAATAVGAAVSAALNRAWVRLVTLVLVGVPLLGWLESIPRGWAAGATIAVVGVYALHLLAEHGAFPGEGDAGTGQGAVHLALLHLNGLWLGAALWQVIEPRALPIAATVSAAAAAWNGTLFLLNRTRANGHGLHYVALASAYLAAAFALRFDGPPVMVAWAAEGVGLVWLGLRTGRWWLQAGGASLVVVAVFQAFEAMLTPLPVGAGILFNPRTLASLFVVAACHATARLWKRADAPSVVGGARTAAVLVANVLTIVIVSMSIQHYFLVGARAADRVAAVTSAYRQANVALSIAWALYAVGLIAVGFRQRFAALRYLAIAVLAITTVKVFVVDLSALDRIYRVISSVVVGLLLLAASWLYQRSKLGPRERGEDRPAADA